MRKRTNIRDFLHVLLYREDDAWIAHCLELDLLGDGETPGQALQRLWGVIITQVNYLHDHDQLDLLYCPAPLEYWRKLGKAKSLGEVNLTEETPASAVRLPLHEMARLLVEYQESSLLK